MITDWATFNLSSNGNREWKSSANKSSAFAVTLPRHLYKPGAWLKSRKCIIYSNVKFIFLSDCLGQDGLFAPFLFWPEVFKSNLELFVTAMLSNLHLFSLKIHLQGAFLLHSHLNNSTRIHDYSIYNTSQKAQLLVAF